MSYAAKAPLVSIILPCFNAAPFIGEALERISRLEFEDYEVLIVDDGSTDETNMLAVHAASLDERLHVITQENNGGVAEARHRAVMHARGIWVWMIDVDDAWRDDALNVMLDAGEGADMVIAGAQYKYEDGSSKPIEIKDGLFLSGRQAFEMLLSGEIKGHLWNKLFRGALLLEISFTKSRVHSDLSIVAEALACARHVRTVSTSVYDYRVRRDSIITGGTPRSESLFTVSNVVRSAAKVHGDDKRMRPKLRYFLHRFILLSVLRDSTNPRYTDEHREVLVARIRRELSVRVVPEFLRRRDVRRAMAVIAAKMSRPAAVLLARKLNER